jgi:TorA maturation chaperone TorD
MNTHQQVQDDELTLARQLVYHFLSLAVSDPKSKRWPQLNDAGLADACIYAAEFLKQQPQCTPPTAAPGELSPDSLDIAAIVRVLHDPQADVNWHFEKLFGLMVSKKCPPYETEYCPQTFSVYRSQALADVAGYYRAFGLEPSRDMPERADHVALELEFMSWLIGKERNAQTAEHAQTCRDAQVRFAREHLVWWVPAFGRALLRQAERTAEVAGSGFYVATAGCLLAFVGIERAVLGLEPPTDLVGPRPIEEQEEMSCQSCAAAELT